LSSAAICAGFKRSGERCGATVEPPQTYCWWHDPQNADQRSRAASKAATARHKVPELVEVKAKLRTIADDVLSGRLEKGKGSIAAQILGVFIRTVEVERKIKEADVLEERLEALEQDAEARRGQWGA
jgi:hypothetical protein